MKMLYILLLFQLFACQENNKEKVFKENNIKQMKWIPKDSLNEKKFFLIFSDESCEQCIKSFVKAFTKYEPKYPVEYICVCNENNQYYYSRLFHIRNISSKLNFVDQEQVYKFFPDIELPIIIYLDNTDQRCPHMQIWDADPQFLSTIIAEISKIK